jgi:hypothetical protein
MIALSTPKMIALQPQNPIAPQKPITLIPKKKQRETALTIAIQTPD